MFLCYVLDQVLRETSVARSPNSDASDVKWLTLHVRQSDLSECGRLEPQERQNA
jgi:hypothetical protein